MAKRTKSRGLLHARIDRQASSQTVTPVVAVVGMFYIGTLRPDLIESASELASGTADVIKTHHNDTDLVRQLRQQVTYRSRLICLLT